MDQPTIDVYDREGRRYTERRGVQRPDRVRAFAEAVPVGGLRLDLGCGPGHHLPLLGRPAVALDGARSMVAAAAADHPDVPAVHADVANLPFGQATFDGVWASKVLQHLPATDLPLALADLRRVLSVGGRLELTMFSGEGEEVTTEGSGDDLPGRRFTWWRPERLATVVEAAAFTVESIAVDGDERHARIDMSAVAVRGLPDHVAAGMRLLVCGANPSFHSADSGIGYFNRSNRFWPALAAAGLARRDRDPRDLLRHGRVGMTDLVKRPTPRADELTADEYRTGLDRLTRLCEWLKPAAVAVVGLAGWRVAVDRKAVAGWQPIGIGDVPVYLLPSTSGLNAHMKVADLAEHLATAAAGPPR